MCEGGRALPIADLAAKVEIPRPARARVEGEVLVLAIDGPDGEEMMVQVARSTAPVVAEEAVELADEYAVGRPDHDRIAAFDARYEIRWSLAQSEHVFDIYYTIAYRIRRLVDGVTFDLVEKTFVEA